MTGSRQLVFSSARRAKRSRWIGVSLWILVILAVLALLVTLLTASLWGYAWVQLGADEVPALTADVDALGADGARAPSEATTVLLTTTAPRDPTEPSGPELVAPVWIVQAGGPRETPAVLLLPTDLPMTADGVGATTPAQLQVEQDSSGLVRAVTDYTGIRIDHVVSVEEDTLPRLIDLLGPLQRCAAEDDCIEVTADDARLELADAGPEARVVRTSRLLGDLAATLSAVDLVTSPVATKRAVDTVAAVHTDVSLRGAALLDLAGRFHDAPEPDVMTVPILRNPQTGSSVLLEQAQTIFQRFAEGAPLDGVSDDDGLQQVISEVSVVVLNAAGIPGLAGRVETQLTASGFRVVGTDNAPAFDEGAPTIVRYLADDPAAEVTAIVLAERLTDAQLEPVDRLPDFDGEDVGVQVLAGADLDEQPE